MADKRVEVALGVVLRPSLRAESGAHGARWEVLIAQRLDDAVLGGQLEFPGGKIEAGESVEQAVVRECEEELGVGVQPWRAMTVIEHRYAHARVRLHPWLCRWVRGEARAQQGQAASCAWMAVEALVDERFPPANVTLLAELRRFILETDDTADGFTLSG